jgi:hypothetical protein
MRVLLSFEEEYRVYMEAMADAIRVFRPNVEVATADARELEAQVERFNPQLVICSPHLPNNWVDNQLARIDLSAEPDQPSRFRIGESRWESTNPTLLTHTHLPGWRGSGQAGGWYVPEFVQQRQRQAYDARPPSLSHRRLPAAGHHPNLR